MMMTKCRRAVIERDPVEHSRKALVEWNIFDEKAEKTRMEEIHAETDAAFEAARQAPLPTSDQAWDHIYA